MVTEAIIFFGENNTVKEMLYPEFEAILDHVVGIGEFANQRVPAVYVRINDHLLIEAAVFFYCRFDAGGNADPAWNIPLNHLADKAARGPDLGGGAIRLSCRSQCSVSWHQRELWDPQTENKPSDFEHLVAIVKRNRLGLDHKPIEAVEVPVLQPEIHGSVDKTVLQQLRKKIRSKLEAEFKDLQSSLVAEQKLRIATLKSEAREQIEKLHRHYRQELSVLEENIKDIERGFSEEKNKNIRYKQTLEKQAKGLHQERERFQEQLAATQTVSEDQLKDLQEKFDNELSAEIEKVTSELKEILEIRDVELLYRKEQISGLRDEISQLREEKQALLSDGGDKLLSRLVDAGITFVAYQPGLDHLAVPQMDLFGYLDGPEAYVAEKYGVSESLYHQWFTHFRLPVCQHPEEDSICGEPIIKVDRPINFIPNDSDRCARHNTFNREDSSADSCGNGEMDVTE